VDQTADSEPELSHNGNEEEGPPQDNHPRGLCREPRDLTILAKHRDAATCSGVDPLLFILLRIITRLRNSAPVCRLVVNFLQTNLQS